MKLGRPIDAIMELGGLLVGIAAVVLMGLALMLGWLPWTGRAAGYALVAPLIICAFLGWAVGAVLKHVTR